MMSGPILLILRILLALTLYAFLFWVVWLLWQDFRRHSRSLAVLKAPPLILHATDDVLPTKQRFDAQDVLVGRDPACDCRIDDMTVSAQHARLSYHHNQWWVEDLGSRNGTFLNQEPVADALVIASGDQLRFGQVVFALTIGDD